MEGWLLPGIGENFRQRQQRALTQIAILSVRVFSAITEKLVDFEQKMNLLKGFGGEESRWQCGKTQS